MTLSDRSWTLTEATYITSGDYDAATIIYRTQRAIDNYCDDIPYSLRSIPWLRYMEAEGSVVKMALELSENSQKYTTRQDMWKLVYSTLEKVRVVYSNLHRE
jgi:hypothetical protein